MVPLLYGHINSEEKISKNTTDDVLHVTSYFSLVAFKILTLASALDSLITMCPGEDRFEFILFGVH
jgi:hypothetical protein